MKLQTKIGDLVALIASTDARTKARTDAELLAAANAAGHRESAISALDISLASRGAANKARAAFAKLPSARRNLAAATKTKAETMGKAAAKRGENYSGDTTRAVKWTPCPWFSPSTPDHRRGCR